MSKACPRYFDVVGGVGEVGEDGAVVGFQMIDVDAVVANAAVFLDIDFIAEPVG